MRKNSSGFKLFITFAQQTVLSPSPLWAFFCKLSLTLVFSIKKKNTKSQIRVLGFLGQLEVLIRCQRMRAKGFFPIGRSPDKSAIIFVLVMTVGKDSFWVSWGNETGEMEKANKMRFLKKAMFR